MSPHLPRVVEFFFCLTDTSLETVVGETELGEPLEPPNVRREGAEVVGAEGEDGDVGAVLEQFLGQERVGVAPRGGYVVEVELHEVERPVNKKNECLQKMIPLPE